MHVNFFFSKKQEVFMRRKYLITEIKTPNSFSVILIGEPKRKDNVPTLLVDDTVIFDDFIKAKTLSEQHESVFTIDNGIEPHVNPMMPSNYLRDIIIFISLSCNRKSSITIPNLVSFNSIQNWFISINYLKYSKIYIPPSQIVIAGKM